MQRKPTPLGARRKVCNSRTTLLGLQSQLWCAKVRQSRSLQTSTVRSASHPCLNMHASIKSYVETIREEIKRIQIQELFYRKFKYPTFQQTAAHDRRESRLRQIQAELKTLRQS